MSRITRSDFQEWKMHKCTIALMDQLQVHMENLKMKLATSAGVDPAEDRFHSGYFVALHDLLGVELAEEEATSDAPGASEA